MQLHILLVLISISAGSTLGITGIYTPRFLDQGFTFTLTQLCTENFLCIFKLTHGHQMCEFSFGGL